MTRPLQCFGGQPAPPHVQAGWQCFLQLPPEARQDFWEVLEPVLRDPAVANNDNFLDGFCDKHSVAQEDVIAAITACDNILGPASALNLSPEQLRADLVALSDGDTDASDLILSKYEIVKTKVRQGILDMALACHGKVLVGLEWRLDNVIATDRGAELSQKIVMLSLRYQDGEKFDRITLQLTPDALSQLRAFAERFSQ